MQGLIAAGRDVRARPPRRQSHAGRLPRKPARRRRQRALLAHRRADARVGDRAGADRARRQALPDRRARQGASSLGRGARQATLAVGRSPGSCSRRCCGEGLFQAFSQLSNAPTLKGCPDTPTRPHRSRAGRCPQERAERDPAPAPLVLAALCVLALALVWVLAELVLACAAPTRACCTNSRCSNGRGSTRSANTLLHLLDPPLFVIWGVALVRSRSRANVRAWRSAIGRVLGARPADGGAAQAAARPMPTSHRRTTRSAPHRGPAGTRPPRRCWR